VHFVPSLKESLISVKKLTEKRIQINFEKKKRNVHACTVIADLNENLYKLRNDNKVIINN